MSSGLSITRKSQKHKQNPKPVKQYQHEWLCQELYNEIFQQQKPSKISSTEEEEFVSCINDNQISLSEAKPLCSSDDSSNLSDDSIGYDLLCQQLNELVENEKQKHKMIKVCASNENQNSLFEPIYENEKDDALSDSKLMDVLSKLQNKCSILK